MSHRASHWLATIPAEQLTAGEFRVLFHLCDAHNSQRDPETACFPSQETLRAATGLSNGGLNNALNAMEEKQILRRIRTRGDDGKRGPTFYILGCDFDRAQEPTPKSGDGTNSTFEASPTPLFDHSQLHPTGVEPVIGTSNRTGNECASLGFDDFWKVYPKKQGKAEAKRAWEKAIKKAAPQIIIERAKRYAEWLSESGPNEFRPHAKFAQGWLNGERWNDDVLKDQPRVNRFAKLAGE